MNEYEKIIKIVVENVSARKMMEEDAVTILISLFNIAKGNMISINDDFRPYTPPVTWNDAPGSLPESLLKQATTLPYGEDEKNVKV